MRIRELTYRELSDRLDEMVEAGQEDTPAFGVAYREWQRRVGDNS